MSDDIVALVRFVLSQARLVDILFLQLADQACVLESLFVRCDECHRDPVTVEHPRSGGRFCDSCAARLIVASGEHIRDPEPAFAGWIDVPEADRIRRMSDYTKIIKQLDVLPEQVQ